jgi:hypothetical protein
MLLASLERALATNLLPPSVHNITMGYQLGIIIGSLNVIVLEDIDSIFIVQIHRLGFLW